jgi:hypothetical protein
VEAAASATTMKSAATAAVGTSSTAATVTAAMLSESCIGCKSKTDESSKYDEEPKEKTKSTHIINLPS